jgi:biotin operon repressor
MYIDTLNSVYMKVSSMLEDCLVGGEVVDAQLIGLLMDLKEHTVSALIEALRDAGVEVSIRETLTRGAVTSKSGRSCGRRGFQTCRFGL